MSLVSRRWRSHLVVQQTHGSGRSGLRRGLTFGIGPPPPSVFEFQETDFFCP